MGDNFVFSVRIFIPAQALSRRPIYVVQSKNAARCEEVCQIRPRSNLNAAAARSNFLGKAKMSMRNQCGYAVINHTDFSHGNTGQRANIGASGL